MQRKGIFFAAIALLFVVVLFLSLQHMQHKQAPAEMLPSYSEEKLGNNVTIILLNAECNECSTASTILSNIKKYAVAFGLNITNITVEWNSTEGLKLVKKYNITKVPTLLLSKEANFSPALMEAWEKNKLGTKEDDNTFVLRALLPPYVDLTQNASTVGIVSVTEIIDPACNECYNVSRTFEYLSVRFKMVFGNITTYEFNSTEGKQLVTKYNISNLPSFILSEDAAVYDYFEDYWPTIGTKDGDVFVYRRPWPPYVVNITGNKTVVGSITFIELVDENCADCYDVSFHYEQLTQLYLLHVVNRTRYDIGSTEGQELIARYNITMLPTILLSPDTKYYTSLADSWNSSGTIEPDGWFVFRNVASVGKGINVSGRAVGQN